MLFIYRYIITERLQVEKITPIPFSKEILPEIDNAEISPTL